MKALSITCLFLLSLLPSPAQEFEEGVVKIEEFHEQKIQLKVAQPGKIYATNKGGRVTGYLKEGTTAQLISMTDRAYYISGIRSDGMGTFGWVTPKAFSSKDPDFIAKLKAQFDRQVLVRDLIAEGQIAIGMTIDECTEILGRPTRTTVKQDQNGQKTILEFTEYDEKKHYINLRDPFSGAYYRRFSHATNEISSQSTLEFEKGFLISSEMSETHGRQSSRILTAPVIFSW